MVDREEWRDTFASVGREKQTSSNVLLEKSDDSLDIAFAGYRKRRKRPVTENAAPKKSATIQPVHALSVSEPPALLGSSAAMKALRKEIEIFAAEEEPVLICGETGAGKELVALELHRASGRHDKPFLVRNVSGVSPELAGSEFFGHVKGAFTGAVNKKDGVFVLANGGVLHLDEIGDLPLEAQSQFLRVIEDGVVTPVGGVQPQKVNVRIIAATNVNLADAIRGKRFREDLYHRLNVLRINVPPLRQRGEDIIEIAEYWLARRGAEMGRTAILTPPAKKKLLAYSWPGNARELKNTVIRAAVLAENGSIKARHITMDPDQHQAGEAGLNIAAGKKLTAHYLTARALDQTGGNASKAAELTGLSRSTFMALKKELQDNNQTTEELAESLCAMLVLKCG